MRNGWMSAKGIKKQWDNNKFYAQNSVFGIHSNHTEK